MKKIKTKLSDEEEEVKEKKNVKIKLVRPDSALAT